MIIVQPPSRARVVAVVRYYRGGRVLPNEAAILRDSSRRSARITPDEYFGLLFCGASRVARFPIPRERGGRVISARDARDE